MLPNISSIIYLFTCFPGICSRKWQGGCFQLLAKILKSQIFDLIMIKVVIIQPFQAKKEFTENHSEQIYLSLNLIKRHF